jgi:DNA-binding transcriptional regulator of glucitol operon
VNHIRTASGTGGDATGSAVGPAYSAGVSTNQVPRVGAPGGRPTTSHGVLRLVLSPRWIAWHLLTLGGMVTCGFLSAWQWHRAGSAMGSALNVGYGLQWPVFAVFFGWIWWRMLRIEVTRLQEAAPQTAGEIPSAPSEPSPFAHRPGAVRAVSDADDPELAEYNRMLAALAARDGEEQD